MTDRPILMSAPMVRALLDGRKTQTRRLAWREGKYSYGYLAPTIWQKVRPGDRLWVRETWVHTGTGVWSVGDAVRALDGKVIYRADGEPKGVGWFPSIHMPRWASRITLTVTETRRQRLQEISEDDAKAEGCGLYVAGHGWITMEELRADPGYSVYLVARHGFQDIWRNLHGRESWDKNPEVIALTFTVQQCNIDSKDKAA